VTLRWRIALILAGVALGVGAFAASASYLTTSRELRSSIDDTLKSRAAAVNIPGSGGIGRGRGDRDGRDPDDDNGCASPGAFQPASAAQVVSLTGTVTSCIEGGPALPTTDRERALSPGTIELRTVTVNGARYRVLSTPWHDGGTLQIARSLSESGGLLGRLRLQLALLVAAATAVAAGLGWAIATRLARPIVRLRDAAHNIATTMDLAAPVDAGGSGEVASLASSFSMMVAAVARSQDQQRRLVSDASHEMRTPLTSLRSNVELIRQIERLPRGERQEVIADVLEDVDELSTLLAELVELASDLGNAEPEEPVDLADLAASVAARTGRRSERVVTVERTGASNEVTGRARQLERAISNLVDNAVKYSPPDAGVQVAVDDTTVTVRDHGDGIAEADFERVFDRFYRAVEVRTEPGSGLGLSIVAEIVRTHGGTVFARNATGGGAEVGFTLPSGAQ
jgi:two-component system sensor histidine kinase MprB